MVVASVATLITTDVLNCSSLPNSSSPGSAAVGGKFFYDIDGKVPFSYYERKPELYDLDGKHRLAF